MTNVTFTQEEFAHVLSILDVDLAPLTSRKILALEKYTPLKPDLLLAIAKEQIRVETEALLSVIRAEYEEAQETTQ